MKGCTICKVEKPLDEFSSYFNTRQQKNVVYSMCKECKKVKLKTYNHDKEKKTIRDRKSRLNCIERVRKNKRDQYEKKKVDLLYKERVRRKALIRWVLKHGNDISKAEQYLGCSIQQFKEYISTYGDLNSRQIDHIIPISRALNVEELNILSHYTNLRLLEPDENLLKKDKILEYSPSLYELIKYRIESLTKKISEIKNDSYEWKL